MRHQGRGIETKEDEALVQSVVSNVEQKYSAVKVDQHLKEQLEAAEKFKEVKDAASELGVNLVGDVTVANAVNAVTQQAERSPTGSGSGGTS